MNTFQKTVIALAVVGVVGVASSGDALALSAGSIIGPVIRGVTSYIGGPFTAVLGQISGAASAKVSAEINKAAMANKAVLEGLVGYQMEHELRKDIQRMQEEAEMPATTCADMAAQDGINKAAQSMRAATFGNQERVLGRLRSNTNTAASLKQFYESSNANFCTPQEASRGICKLAVSGPYQGLAGADQNAAFLFQGPGSQGGYSHSNEQQTEAAMRYVERVVAGVPPEQLRDKSLDTTEQGKAYTELLRRYNAVLSMSSYSLQNIVESHRPRKGLGNDTMMANAPGFPQKADMSMFEAVDRFVSTKFSPEKIRDMQSASQPHKILRDMAQTGAFQLWVDYQSLLQGSRIEALQAHQLALLTEQVLRPQLEAQRAAASAAERVR